MNLTKSSPIFTQRTTATSTPSSAASPSAQRPAARATAVVREPSPTARIVRGANAVIPVAR
jgi:hypothetical protein